MAVRIVCVPTDLNNGWDDVKLSTLETEGRRSSLLSSVKSIIITDDEFSVESIVEIEDKSSFELVKSMVEIDDKFSLELVKSIISVDIIHKNKSSKCDKDLKQLLMLSLQEPKWNCYPF